MRVNASSTLCEDETSNCTQSKPATASPDRVPITTWNPSADKVEATAKPIPRFAPVTRAIGLDDMREIYWLLQRKVNFALRRVFISPRICTWPKKKMMCMTSLVPKNH